MAGVEIAGLVLAVVPLVAAAADHQRRVYGATMTVRKSVKDEKLASHYQHLHNEVALLNLTIRNLVLDLPTISSGEKSRLLELDQQLWADNRVSLALLKKLGTSNDTFVDTLRTVLQSLDDILSDRVLNLGRSDIVQQPRALYKKLKALRTNGGDPNDLRGRIKFTSSDRKRRRALATLTEHNKTLERFIRYPTPAEPAEELGTMDDGGPWKWPPRSESRELIHGMYDVIAEVWKSQCTCPTPHEARLSLLACFAWFEDASDDDLDLWISTGLEDMHSKWQESRVHVEPPQQRFQNPAVRFENTPSPVRPVRTVPLPSVQKLHIDSICSLVAQAHQSNVALEFVYDINALWHVRPRRQRRRLLEPCATLDHLLRHEAQRRLKEKRILAVILAHSLLHLCESNWLEKEWYKTHISFLPTDLNQPELKQPYLNTDFQALAGKDDSAMMAMHPSPAILTLGILLLELQIWGPIEDERLPQDLTDDGLVGVNTNLMTAERVFQDSVDDLFENYKSAIMACLHCDFFEQDVDFSNEGFRRLVYANIVAPLEKELYQGFKLKPEDL